MKGMYYYCSQIMYGVKEDDCNDSLSLGISRVEYIMPQFYIMGL
jgi:hypothetical protein